MAEAACQAPRFQWNTDNLTVEQDATIPESGWYGIFISGLDSTNDECTGTSPCSLCLQSPNKIEEEVIPLEHDGTPMNSLLVGTLFFLHSGTRVRIVACPNDNDDDSNHLHDVLVWSLRFHRREMAPTEKKRWLCAKCTKTFSTVRSALQHVHMMHSSKKDTHMNDDDSDNCGAVLSYSHPMWKEPLQVLYQDDYLAAIIKPQGMPVQGSKVTLCRSHLLLSSLDPSSLSSNVLRKPRPVHRLDAATGGILIVAKTAPAESTLRSAFMNRKCQKRYWALVLGKMKQAHGVYEGNIQKKPSKTVYNVIKYVRSISSTTGWMTLVELEPVTGRKHQLRRHLQAMGHAIVGDMRYGGCCGVVPSEQDNRMMTFQRLCLWAMEITLPHPNNDAQILNFKMDPPKWLQDVIRQEEDQWTDLRCSPEIQATETRNSNEQQKGLPLNTDTEGPFRSLEDGT